MHRRKPVGQSTLRDNPSTHPIGILPHHISSDRGCSRRRRRRRSVKPEIRPFRDAGLLGREGKEECASRIAPAHERDALLLFQHLVQPQRIVRDEAAIIVPDFDGRLDLVLRWPASRRRGF